MSTTARKARKRSRRVAASYGEIANPSEFQFRREPKTPTPFQDRSTVAGLVRGPASSKHEGRLQPRSEKKVRRLYEARGLEYSGDAE